MRITIAQGAFYPIPPLRGGGVEKAWFALGREFARLGHEVTHISRQFGDLPANETVDGVTHIRVPGFDSPRSLVKLKLLDLIYTRRVLRVLPQADILVTHTFWLPIFLRSNRFGRVYIHVARFPRGQMRYYTHVARLQTVSTSLRDAIVREIPQFASKVCAIPNPLTSEARPPSGRPRDRILLYVGRLHPEKGLHILLDALALLPSSRLADWKLVVIGSAATSDGGGGDNYLAALKQKAAPLGDRVTWAGPVFDAERLNGYFQQAALFLYPSLADFGEASPLAPLEAMSQGCPALVSDIGCFRDYLRDGENGFVFNHLERPVESLAAKLDTLLDAPDRLRHAGELAEQSAQDYRIEAVARNYLDDFKSLLPRRPQPQVIA
jgi:glycosyltransferase involved in cell wall biosynthesis